MRTQAIIRRGCRCTETQRNRGKFSILQHPSKCDESHTIINCGITTARKEVQFWCHARPVPWRPARLMNRKLKGTQTADGYTRGIAKRSSGRRVCCRSRRRLRLGHEIDFGREVQNERSRPGQIPREDIPQGTSALSKTPQRAKVEVRRISVNDAAQACIGRTRASSIR